jgi:hypothetical protein
VVPTKKWVTPPTDPGGQLEARVFGDQQLAGGGGDRKPVVLGRNLVDPDQLRKLAQILLALVLQRARIGVGRGGLIC